MDVISVSAVLYIINFANCYQNGPKKKLEKKLRKEEKVKKAITIELSTLGKLLVFLVNYAYYTTFFIMKRLGKGCFGGFGTHYGYFHYFLWEK
jgi:hypothetical protein